MLDNSSDLKIDKYLGAFLCAAIGDALGWPNEQNSNKVSKVQPKDKKVFQKWCRYVGGKFWSHYEEINPGEYSDDTQLLIATARSLNHGQDWSKHFSKVELPAWISYERGGGGATKRAATAWKKGNYPWYLGKNNLSEVKRYFNAGGNGIAMRILPHVFRNENNPEDIMYQVVLNGISTHGHPRALIGATLYADALIYLANLKDNLAYGGLVDYLLKRKDTWGKLPDTQDMNNWLNNADKVMNFKYIDEWNRVLDEVTDLLKIAKQGLDEGALDMGTEVLEKIGCFDKKVNGAGTVTAVAAIYLASKYASSPDLGIIESAYLKKADTDTLASMTGGLLGMLHGTGFVSASWIDIQDYDYIRDIIHHKEIGSKINQKKEPEVLDYANSVFNTKLKTLKAGESIEALPFGKLTLKEKKLNQSNSHGNVIHTLKLISEAGQSIFIKTFEKDKEDQPQNLAKPGERQNTNLDTSGQYSLPSNKIPERTEYRTLLDFNKVRSLANILPENMPSEQCLFLISDIMAELERSKIGMIGNSTLNYLLKQWAKYHVSNREIHRIINIINNR
jgi:ADP-ribosylglycohydrolase